MPVDEMFPQQDQLIALEREEVGALILRFIDKNSASSWNRHNFVTSYAIGEPDAVKEALVEGWMWLEHEGFLIPYPSGASNDFVQISRRGRQLLQHGRFSDYKLGPLLSRQLLDAALAKNIPPLFLRGDYDTAVFQAFREVEIRVRTAKLSDQKIGTDLMREVFNPEHGPLRNSALPPAERDAWSHLFATAIALFKNPGSHRKVDIRAQEAAELISLANYLLRVVDLRNETDATS